MKLRRICVWLLSIIGVYGSTGNQPTARAEGTDIAALARAAGCKHVIEATDERQLQDALKGFSSGLTVIVAHAEAGNAEVPIIELTAPEIKKRFMRHWGLLVYRFMRPVQVQVQCRAVRIWHRYRAVHGNMSGFACG